MLKTLNEAKEYVFDRIAQVAKEEISETEKMLISTELEEKFFGAVALILSEEEFDELQATTEEELDAKLFYKLPNYISLLEEITTNFLIQYLEGAEFY